MKILNVDLIKDREIGWCYVVDVSFGDEEQHSSTYVVLKPVADRHKKKQSSNVTDLTKDGEWEKLFGLLYDSTGNVPINFMNSLSSYQFDVRDDNYAMFIAPKDNLIPMDYSSFSSLNSKGIDL